MEFFYCIQFEIIFHFFTLNVYIVSFDDDGGRRRDGYFGSEFSKLDQHDVWYLPSAATKSSMFKLKVKNLKRLFFCDRVRIQNYNIPTNANRNLLILLITHLLE